MNEVFPAIVVDLEVGNYVDDIDFDYDKLSEYMREKGFSDEEINDTTIRANSKITRQSKGKTQYTLHGQYTGHRRTKRAKQGADIQLYPIPSIQHNQEAEQCIRTMSEGNPNDWFIGYFNYEASRELSSTLVHELEHKVVHHEGRSRDIKRYIHKNSAKELGQFIGASATGTGIALGLGAITHDQWWGPLYDIPALAAVGGLLYLAEQHPRSVRKRHDSYLNNPEEIRCREAEKTGPNDLVSVAIKYATDPPETTAST